MAPRLSVSSAPTRRPKLHVGTACDQCFRTKSRCAGERPSCGRCLLNGSLCTYSTGNKKKPLATGHKSPRPSASSLSPPCSSASSCLSYSTPAPRAYSTEPPSIERYDTDSSNRKTSNSHDASSVYSAAAHNIQEMEFKSTDMFNVADAIPMAEIKPWSDNPNPSPPHAESQSDQGLLFPPPNTYHPHGVIPTPLPNSLDSGFATSSHLFTDASSRRPSPSPPCNGIPEKDTSLGTALSRLHTYIIGISHENPEQVLLHLQENVSLVERCVRTRETTHKDTMSGLPSPPETGSIPPLNAAETVTCIHLLQLTMACYAQMRQQYQSPPSHPWLVLPAAGTSDDPCTAAAGQVESLAPSFESRYGSASPFQPSDGSEPYMYELDTYQKLLDVYLRRDIRLCQAVAERLVALVRRELLVSFAKADSALIEQLVGSLATCMRVF